MPFHHPPRLFFGKKSFDHLAKNGLHANVFLNHDQSYRGEWLNNQKHGHGILKHRGNQWYYEGEFVHDRKEGHGRLTCINEQGEWQRIYVGQWKNDRWNGFGTRYFTASSFYQGEFLDNQRDGWGYMVYDNGDI